MAERSGSSRHARAASSLWKLLLWVLLFEAILDVFGLPLDEILIPLEVILDIGLVLVALVSTSGSGQAIGTGRGLRKSRGGVTHVSGIGVLVFWAFFAVIIAFQIWFASQHQILTLLFGIFELLFDGFLLLLGFLLTIGAVLSLRHDSVRQIGTGRG